PPGESTTVVSDKMWFQPTELLPVDRARFYRYEGSLTTPGCDEIVTWTVMEAPLMLPRIWMAYITDTYAYDLTEYEYVSTEFVSNQRAQQDLNGRRVILRDPTSTKTMPAKTPNSAAHNRWALWPLAAAIAVLLIICVKILDGKRKQSHSSLSTTDCLSACDLPL
ncbi:eukaryotic-type carbonic anhydrase, partial [Aphelenchoides avenae]